MDGEEIFLKSRGFAVIKTGRKKTRPPGRGNSTRERNGRMPRDYQRAIDFLENRTNYERFRQIPYDRMGENLPRLARFVGTLPLSRRAKTIHLAGTKGKGTTALFLEKIFRDRGARTGLFTSPHLFAWEERFAVGGVPCAADDLAETLLELEERLAAFEKNDPGGIPFTAFELSTAAALLLFEKKECDLILLETGLGGRRDATNICRPDLVVLTSLGYEHQRQLGSSLAEIAAEKGGIIKPRVPVVSGIGIDRDRLPPSSALGALPVFLREKTVTREAISGALSVIRRIAFDLGAPLFEPTRVGPEAAAAARSRIGSAPARCAQIALSAAELLAGPSDAVRRRAWCASIRGAVLPARGEILRRAPLVIVDGAHTRDSAASLAEGLEPLGAARRTLVFAALADKDVEGILWELMPKFDRVFLTEIPDTPRSLGVGELEPRARRVAAALPPDRVPAIAAEADAAKLFRAARDLPADELLCAAGSFRLAALAAAALRE